MSLNLFYPMSPFIFIMAAEALVSVLNNAEEKGRLNGIKLDKHGPAVHHLLFADDSLLMCKADLMESLEIMRCLKVYGEASGQQINPSKSSIIFGDKVEEGVKADIKQILRIDKEGGEGTYLGLPEVFKGSKKLILSYIREKLQHRLHGWFSRTLSQGGKEVLLKSIGLALPVYAMSVYKLPKDLCAKLTSAMREFWWSNGSARKKCLGFPGILYVRAKKMGVWASMTLSVSTKHYLANKLGGYTLILTR